MDLSEQQSVFAINVAKLIIHIFTTGYRCTFGEVYRTAEQASIDSKKGIGIVDSQHCKRLAIDLNLFTTNDTYINDSKEYEKFGLYWESLNPRNRWGGHFHKANGKPFPDLNHFEMQEN